MCTNNELIDLLNPKRYSTGNYGLIESENGQWVSVSDILNAIDCILWDDAKMEERVIALRDSLSKYNKNLGF